MSRGEQELHNEIDSLAAEIVHAYEELHLLYELGQVLTSDLSVSQVTDLILEKILHALSAYWILARMSWPTSAALS